MNQKQAFAAAAKLLGVGLTKVGMRINKAALTGEERQQAIEQARATRTALKAAQEARDARRQAILDADIEYQTLKQAAVDADEADQAARSRAHGRRVTILRLGSMFNVQEAEGDNFADAIEDLKRKKKPAA